MRSASLQPVSFAPAMTAVRCSPSAASNRGKTTGIRRWAANSNSGVAINHVRMARWSNEPNVPDTHPTNVSNAIIANQPVTTSRINAPESEASRARLFG